MCAINCQNIRGQNITVQLGPGGAPVTVGASAGGGEAGADFGYGHPTIKAAIANADYTDIKMVDMEWGFIPPWINTRAEVLELRKNKGKANLNARDENLLTGMWRPAALGQRCLVLSTGFVETRHVQLYKPNGQPYAKKETYPYRVWVKDQQYFWFAGIYNHWLDRENGRRYYTVAIVTTEANGLMKQIHNNMLRMPTILDERLAKNWVLGDLNEKQIAFIARTKISSKDMGYATISKEFYSTGNMNVDISYPECPDINWSIIND